MATERPRKPELSTTSITHHIIDAVNELSKLNKEQEQILAGFALLSERQQLITQSIVETARKIIDGIPIEWIDQEEESHLLKKGTAQLVLPEEYLNISTRRLRALISASSNGAGESEPVQLKVECSKPQMISKNDEPPVNFYRMKIELNNDGRSLSLNLSWDEDDSKPDAKIEFSHNIGIQVIWDVLNRQQLFDPNDKWRELEDAAGFLTLIENSSAISP